MEINTTNISLQKYDELKEFEKGFKEGKRVYVDSNYFGSSCFFTEKGALDIAFQQLEDLKTNNDVLTNKLDDCRYKHLFFGIYIRIK